jgi:hypothetical protein
MGLRRDEVGVESQHADETERFKLCMSIKYSTSVLYHAGSCPTVKNSRNN